ncbi:MAG: hypothetical protein RI953_1062 [Pseudomonadota bacterium]|jgi:hypothetical protein
MVGDEFNGKGGALSKQSLLSKQVIDIWHSVLASESSIARSLAILTLVITFHSLPFFVPVSWLKASKDSAPRAESVLVRINQPKTTENKEPVQPEEAVVERKPSPAKVDAKKVLTSTEPSDETAPSAPLVPVPDKSSESAQPPSSIQNKPALPKERISPLFPAGKDEFIAKQRNLGETLGAGAIAGDVDIPDVVSEKDPNSPVTRTEYTFAGYFDSLSRRFVEAWGGVRTLPPESRFEGKLGEFIEYDIVINRDGSLRKIVNISAKREPFRDFAAVDELVQSVFKAMFPFQPVPDRIRNDPLVVRKRIQFVGFKYTLY